MPQVNLQKKPFFFQFYLSGTRDQMSIYVDWTNQEQIIGHYWFIIEKAFLGEQYVNFELRILRQVSGNEKSSGRCPHCGKLPLQDSSNSTSLDDPLSLSDIGKPIL